MAQNSKSFNVTWPDWASLVLGAWLLVSPWLLGFAGTAQWNAMVIGAIVVIVTLGALMEWHAWEEWVDMLVGLWLVISPWVLGFAFGADGALVAAAWNAILVGAGVAVLAAWSWWSHGHPGLGAH